MYPRGETAVLKLYRPGFGGHHTEALALRALEDSGVAPKLLDVVEFDGRVGLLVERLSGPDLLALLQRRPWRVGSIARVLARAQLDIHRVQAPLGLADLRTTLAERIVAADLPRQLFDFVARVLDNLPGGDRLCHGDYHPGNVLLVGGRSAVIDWGAATRGASEADHARTLLLLRWADPLPDTPPLTKALIASGRSLLATAYARAYRRGSTPLRHTSSWLVVHAAARLSEGIPSERKLLIRRLEDAQRRAR